MSSKVANDPPLKKRGKDWVPLEPPATCKSVADPIAATLVRADSLRRRLQPQRAGCLTANCAPT